MLNETYQRLTKELEQLKTVERVNIAKIIDEARALGDLKENAEYHAAKDKQGHMESRIIELQDLLSRAQVVDPASFQHTRVSFGSTVTLCDLSDDSECKYTIVGAQESSPAKGLISIFSPLAKSIMGREEGDEVEVALPGGSKQYAIEEICFQEIYIEVKR